MAYSTVQDVLKAAGLGMTVQRITQLHGDDMTDAQVTTMIEEMIEEADEEIQEELDVPILIQNEIHIADGEVTKFLLGPTDEEHYTSQTVEDCLEKVVHCYFGCYQPENRRKHPFPTDCDGEFTEDSADASNWNSIVTNCTVTRDATTYFCGAASMKYVFTAAGSSTFTLPENKNINQYDYIALAIISSVSTPTFTIKLIAEDGDTVSQTFTVDRASVWQVIWIKIDNMSGSVDWDTKKLFKIEFDSTVACQCYLDMLNFNDGYCWSAPQGYLYIHEAENAGENPYEDGYKFFVTYEYDPYLVTTPKLIRRASKYFAAADLVNHLIGLRQSLSGFEQQNDSGEPIPDKDTLIFNEKRLRQKGQEALQAIGFGWEFAPIKGETGF